MKKSNENYFWEKLDNTANIFPAIADSNMTNVYRISVTLNEEIDGVILGEALREILPHFKTFNVRLRRGIFWHYFDENRRDAPIVKEEEDYPCSYIEPYSNNNYLFRVSYYKRRINLEVFHALADGMGGINFLREITYEYLRRIHPDLNKKELHGFSDETSMCTEDSYLKHFRKNEKKEYEQRRAIEIKGERLTESRVRVIHGFMSVKNVKETAKKYNVTINELFVAVFIYSIYKEYLNCKVKKKPVSISIPVNLRPYFESLTTRNFFVMVSAVFVSDSENYSLADIIEIVKKSLRKQITKEHLEKLFSYNVSNQKNIILRSVPVFIKMIAIRLVYNKLAKANTSTITNIGNITVKSEYEKYISHFSTMISKSLGQNIKGAVCSYGDVMVFTTTSFYKDASIEKCFFRTLQKEGVDIMLESN